MAKIGGGKFSVIPSVLLAAAIAAVLFLSLVAAGAAAQSISFTSAGKTVDQGSATTLDIVLDSVPKGLAGYEINVSLASPDKAEIISVEFPDWAGLNKNGTFPSDNVMISGVDLGRKIQAGATNVPLATITIRGDSAGSTAINIIAREIDADGGSPIITTVKNGQLTVRKAATASTQGPVASSPAPGSPTGEPATESLTQPYVLAVLGLVALAGASVFIYSRWKGKK